MAISKHGKRVDEILSRKVEPAKPPNIQDEITRVARVAEVEQICTYIQEWIERRLGRYFSGMTASVKYDIKMDWYEARVDFLYDKTIYSGMRCYRGEDVDRHSGSTESWSRLMDSGADSIKNTIRNKMISNGVKTIPTARLNISSQMGAININGQMGAMQQSFQAASKSLNEMNLKLYQDPNPSEVEAAIESIQQVMKKDE